MYMVGSRPRPRPKSPNYNKVPYCKIIIGFTFFKKLCTFFLIFKQAHKNRTNKNQTKLKP